MIVSLSGAMGCGKSTVGECLAQALGWPYIDLDAYIEEMAGAGIPEIFSARGEEAFREMEEKALGRLCSAAGLCGESMVLSLGGGTLMRGGCRDIVRDSCFNIYLSATPETLARRLQGETGGRPLLGGTGSLEEKITGLLNQRKEVYEQAADLTVQVDGKSPEDIVDEIFAVVSG